jgi:hypothetical protein
LIQRWVLAPGANLEDYVMPFTWTPPTGKCPKDVKALREALKVKAKAKSGDLISDKFKKDHVYSGHSGPVTNLGATLAKLRELPLSTLMISSMSGTALKEVLNWIDKAPDNIFTLRGGTWTIANRGGAVDATASYKFATVDLEALKAMNADDRVKKSRKWLTESMKTPKIACVFDDDGTPQIYHLDY